MTTELETPRITELHVRMDCNGCGNKLRKTLSAIDGVSEVYIDKASHKITVVGMADPERMVKAIRKTKRVPTIFSHTDPAAAAAAAAAAEAQPPPPADGEAAEGEAQAPPPAPADPPAADAVPPAAAEAAEEAAPAEAPAPENKEAKPAETPAAMDATVVRTVLEYPYGHGHGNHMYSEHWAAANHPTDVHGVRYEASPYHANATTTHHHRPTSPYVAEYGGGGYGGFPVQQGRYYIPAEYYPARGKGDDAQITTIFSDENPNACSIA